MNIRSVQGTSGACCLAQTHSVGQTAQCAVANRELSMHTTPVGRKMSTKQKVTSFDPRMPHTTLQFEAAMWPERVFPTASQMAQDAPKTLNDAQGVGNVTLNPKPLNP